MKTTPIQTGKRTDGARSHQAGLSLVEIMAVLAVLSFIISGGLIAFGGAKVGTATTSLLLHTKQLNSALALYEANGGKVDSSDTAASILLKLKASADSDHRDQIAGLRGKLVDARLKPVRQSKSEASQKQWRVVWDGSRQRFDLRKTGRRGIKEFKLDDSSVPSKVELAKHRKRKTRLKLAKTSSWVWDYEQPNDADLTDEPDDLRQQDLIAYRPEMLYANYVSTTTTGDEPQKLEPPEFSIPGGELDYREFNLELTLFNVNPVGSSNLIYAVNSGEWIDYATGDTIEVNPNDTVRAMAVSLDTELWLDSDTVDENYKATFMISGDATGDFFNAEGGDNMVTGGAGNYFTWGTPHYSGGYIDPSWILFQGARFEDVQVGERFELGTITYYNGTIGSGTGADGVDLGIEVDFHDTLTREFVYNLQLINVRNDEYAQSGTEAAWASADYVHLQDIYSSTTHRLGDNEYQLLVEFGETSEQGFSEIDSFYVLENETAQGTIYGMLVEGFDIDTGDGGDGGDGLPVETDDPAGHGHGHGHGQP